jgi:hypothetical protein
MPREATGTTFQDRSGRWFARVTLGNRGSKDRPAFALPERFDRPAAEARKAVLADLAARLRAAPTVPRDIAEGLLERAAAAEGKRLADVHTAADRILGGGCRSRARSGRTRRSRRSANRGPRASLRASTRTTSRHGRARGTTPARSSFTSTRSWAACRSSRSTWTTRTRSCAGFPTTWNRRHDGGSARPWRACSPSRCSPCGSSPRARCRAHGCRVPARGRPRATSTRTRTACSSRRWTSRSRGACSWASCIGRGCAGRKPRA